ncbi:cysteine hydrolase family protein [Streptomyces cavernicola]|uniref:Cysteine hydrolase n=1 Tax=Streptomyces cavernicola TaxID=3043613 RepID=A0ABT6SL91_9ACTN|nr:cysteine hydrolase [Streptomyces sp. B-S-A6]MDI3408962.1 cysteine hydrolase [Streptomyces sp. B-S-A6]
MIDMQEAFREPSSGWAVEGYRSIEPVVSKLADSFGDRVVWTRFVRDPREDRAWAAYYDHWPSFRLPETDPAWALTLPVPEKAPVVTLPTFSKWGPELEGIVGDAPLVMCGVATECCVFGTAFAAADAGRGVTVVADACAGASVALHEQALVLLGQLSPLVTVTTSDRLG